MDTNAFLPEPLPSNPMPLFAGWFREAREHALQPNPDAMVLATVGENNAPSARVVLCKLLSRKPTASWCSSPTTGSRKGRELADHPRARQPCSTGTRCIARCGWKGRSCCSPARRRAISISPAARSKAGIGAWASDQSEPLESARRAGRQGPNRATRRLGLLQGTRRRETSRAHRTGAALACGSIRSSCGWKALAGCTTARRGNAT